MKSKKIHIVKAKPIGGSGNGGGERGCTPSQ